MTINGPAGPIDLDALRRNTRDAKPAQDGILATSLTLVAALLGAVAWGLINLL